jgi:hypothetical protein
LVPGELGLREPYLRARCSHLDLALDLDPTAQQTTQIKNHSTRNTTVCTTVTPFIARLLNLRAPTPRFQTIPFRR